MLDGNTIRVRLADGHYEKVRLIGIDTPETTDPDKAGECGGPQATDSMLRLAFTAPRDTDGDGLLDASGGHGRSAVVRTDSTQDTRDRDGRLLAYVTTTSDSDVADADLGAAQLLARWAKVYVFERNFERSRATAPPRGWPSRTSAARGRCAEAISTGHSHDRLTC